MNTMLAKATRVYEAPAVAAAALLAGVLLVFQPAQIYAANESFFFYGLPQILLLLLPAFAVAWFALLGLAWTVPPRARRATEIALAALAVASWGTASFLTASTGIMDGLKHLELAGGTRAWFNAAGYAALLVAGGAAMLRWPVVTRRLLAALFGVLALQATWIAATDAKPWRPAPANERLATFSAERNVLVILLDTLQTDFFADALQAQPELARSFEGFTYFANAVGTAPTTYLSMPTIHAGVRLTSGSGIRALYRENVVEQSFVAKLAAAGYDAILVNPILEACPKGALCDQAEQLVHGQAAALGETAGFLANVAVFRAVPHALKPLASREGAWWTPRHLFTDYALTSNALLERIAREAKPGSPRPTVRFLHLFNTHAPARVDARCQPLANVTWNRPAAVAQARCGLSRVALLLDALRTAGIYDQSAIVLLADHGAGLAREGASGFQLGASASPTLAVKPFGGQGPVAVARELVGLADLSATVCAMTRACAAVTGTDVFARGQRTAKHPFINHVWTSQSLGLDEVPVLDRYDIAGPPGERSSWIRLPPPLPPGPVTHLAFAKADPEGAYGSGWSDFEASGEKDWRWAVGLQSEVQLRIEHPRDMRLQLAVWTHPGNPAQSIRVQINGIPAGELPVGLVPGQVEIAIPREALHPGVNELVFGYRSASPPSAADPRQLAVLFEDLSLVTDP